MVGAPHLSKPDLDNLIKSTQDALTNVIAQDSAIWSYADSHKVWSDVGYVKIILEKW